MLIFFLTASFVWTLVLSFFILQDWRLLLKVLRWSTCIWLLIFGILITEVLREGLIVNGEDSLHWATRIIWVLWFISVAASFLDSRNLIPAVVLPVWLFSHPEVHTLLNYGLVRLKWHGIVYSPMSWVASRPKVFETVIFGRSAYNTVIYEFVPLLLTPVKNLLDYAASWIFRATYEDLYKLRSPDVWSWAAAVRQ
ncbi:hypothetical protein GGR57DRAFT_298628 [Xylariaceae sp. FL1272]|nr:hypothetical protein GGR57DRAFT_298628 [Xylariaceae sp. FL1272]